MILFVVTFLPFLALLGGASIVAVKHDRRQASRTTPALRARAEHVWAMEKELGWEPWPIFGFEVPKEKPAEPESAFSAPIYLTGPMVGAWGPTQISQASYGTGPASPIYPEEQYHPTTVSTVNEQRDALGLGKQIACSSCGSRAPMSDYKHDIRSQTYGLPHRVNAIHVFQKLYHCEKCQTTTLERECWWATDEGNPWSLISTEQVSSERCCCVLCQLRSEVDHRNNQAQLAVDSQRYYLDVANASAQALLDSQRVAAADQSNNIAWHLRTNSY